MCFVFNGTHHSCHTMRDWTPVANGKLFSDHSSELDLPRGATSSNLNRFHNGFFQKLPSWFVCCAAIPATAPAEVQPFHDPPGSCAV